MLRPIVVSAPHAPAAKYGQCGCAGVFTAPVLAQCLVGLFDRECPSAFPWDEFVAFTCANANAFYGFSCGRAIKLERRPFTVPPSCGGCVSYRAGETLPWSLCED